MTRTPRPVALGLFLLATACLAAPRADAAVTPLGIEIDGDYVDDLMPPEEDWFPGHPPRMDPFGSDDDSLCGTSPPPKDDIVQYFVANDFDFLYLGMERLTNNGNTSFFFTFDITGDGPSLGDFIFVFCFQSGSALEETYVLEWDPAGREWIRDATPPRIDFAINASRTVAPFGTYDERGRPENFIGAGRFAEARISLADIEGFDICDAADVTAVMESKASCSLSSECKDTTGPFVFSFGELVADLTLSQPPDCEAIIKATANARSPRSPLTYRWFLDGVDITLGNPSWATSDSIEIPLDRECGPVEVRVVVSDGRCVVEDAAGIDVSRRPEAAISSLVVGACDLTLSFDGTGSSGCNGLPLEYRWDFESDGIIDSTQAAGTHVYRDCGDRLVTLVVVSGGCASAPAGRAVSVNEPPLASLQVIPDACLSIDWSSLSTDCDLDRPPMGRTESLSQVVDFGDGSPPSTDPSGRHEYAECGTYTLTLTVTDTSGCASADARRVTFTGVLDVR
jgi:hypothetical protein